jgi:predicted ATP-dependent endonuclease of OLD family
MLPLYLLRLSHGGREERERFQRILERFKELTGQKAAVRVRWEKPLDKQQLRVEIVLEDRLGDIPIRFAGAGMWEALVLSALLAEEDKVLVLDEPALNLHPPLQRRILKALREREGQVILITHSPYMIPLDEPQDLRRIFRFYKDEKEGATRIRTAPEGAGEADLREMLRWFRSSADVAAFLLAGGVILTEGETESGALLVWWRKSERVRRRGGPEERALAVWSVGGYPGFQRYIRLLKAWGIPWAAVVDGEHVRDVLKANRDALGLNLQETEIDQKEESEIREIAERHGIFTLNQSLARGEKFESLPFVAPCLNQARSEVGDSKVLQGAWIAERTDPPAEVEELYEKICRRLFPEP